ncbi:hypothetical protein [Shewanella putrefaciens]|jgi:hypothetical protein|uniref:hypothetical protein n=1 Tax=Shewanella putrefaciens TaxID=24 RepID=UPI003D7B527C
MGLPVTVYRWDDAGAPQFSASRTPSDFIDILKKCLVTGYGSKSGLGWTVAFENTDQNKIAFRNSTIDGSGGYVQFWCPEGTNISTSRFSYKVAQGMSALDTFSKSSPIVNIKRLLDATYTHWLLIGTSVGFYFTVMANNDSTYNKGKYSCFIGDMQSNVPNDAARFIANSSTGDAVTGSNPTWLLSQDDTPSYATVVLYPTDGGGVSLVGQRRSLVEAGPTNTLNNSSDTSLGISPAYTMVAIRPSSVTYTDVNGTFVNSSLLQPYNRGFFPGLLISSFLGFKTVEFNTNVSRIINGKNHILVPGNSLGGAVAWINIEEWY